MKKITTGVIAIVLLFSLNMAMAKAENSQINSPNPFFLIWKAIRALQGAVEDLQEQIDNIELIPGPEGPQGSPGEQGPPGPSLKVIDANGQEVGYLLEIVSGPSYQSDTQSVRVWNKDFNLTLALYLYDAGIETSYALSGDDFYYGSYDCTGDIYIEKINSPYILIRNGPHDDITYYKVDNYDDVKENLHFNSRLNPDGGCQVVDYTPEYSARVLEISLPEFEGPLSIVEE